MRTCLLRAGLARADGIADFVLGTPKAWLGTAYHSVLENIIGAVSAGESIDAAIERLWNQAISAQTNRISVHPLNRRFGPPSTWPGYYVVKAGMALRAHQLVERGQTMAANEPGSAGSVPNTLREKAFTGFGGKLVGRPDVVRAGEILDYKSGSVVEFDEDAGEETVKAAYVRQLQIYGYLVKEALGWWPTRGLLLPFVGAGVEIALHPADCEQAASEAVSLLDRFNSAIQASASIMDLASPSPEACKWCPFKIACPAIWQNVAPTWSTQTGGAMLEGRFESALPIQGGAAVAVSMLVERGTQLIGPTQIAPLSVAIHGAFTNVQEGEPIRVIGLRARPDRALVPTQKTVIARTQDIPSITVEPLNAVC